MVFGGGVGGAAPAGGNLLNQVIGAASGGRGGSTFSSASTYGYSAPMAKISAGDFAQASGQMMQYAGRFNSSVDGRLLKILNTAASRFDMRVEAISGLRPGDAGDEEAQAALAGISQSYLEEARAWYASSTDYFAIFEEVQSVLASSESIAERDLAAAKSQLDLAKAQLDAINGVKDSVTTLQDALTKALAELATAQKANASLTPGVISGGQTVVGSGVGAYTTGNTSTGSSGSIPAGGINGVSRQDLETWGFLGVQYQAILGRSVAVRSELDFWTAKRNEGWTADQIIAGIKASPEAKARGYAAGGFTGWGGVDEVAGIVHGQEYVMNAATTHAVGVPMLDMIQQTGRLPRLEMPASAPVVELSNDNEAVVATMERVERSLNRLIAVTAEVGQAQVTASRQSAAAQQTIAQNAKRRSSGS